MEQHFVIVVAKSFQLVSQMICIAMTNVKQSTEQKY
jgi:hypothetical protein